MEYCTLPVREGRNGGLQRQCAGAEQCHDGYAERKQHGQEREVGFPRPEMRKCDGQVDAKCGVAKVEISFCHTKARWLRVRGRRQDRTGEEDCDIGQVVGS